MSRILFAALLTGCSVLSLERTDYACPCAQGFVCDEGTQTCLAVQVDAAPDTADAAFDGGGIDGSAEDSSTDSGLDSSDDASVDAEPLDAEPLDVGVVDVGVDASGNDAATPCAQHGQPCTLACGSGTFDCPNGGTATCVATTFLPSTSVCRGAARLCDAVERCTGTSGLCPTDVNLPVTSACPGGSCDMAGACQPTFCAARSADFCTSFEETNPRMRLAMSSATQSIAASGANTGNLGMTISVPRPGGRAYAFVNDLHYTTGTLWVRLLVRDPGTNVLRSDDVTIFELRSSEGTLAFGFDDANGFGGWNTFAQAGANSPTMLRPATAQWTCYEVEIVLSSSNQGRMQVYRGGATAARVGIPTMGAMPLTEFAFGVTFTSAGQATPLTLSVDDIAIGRTRILCPAPL